jgi:hypothetical protein
VLLSSIEDENNFFLHYVNCEIQKRGLHLWQEKVKISWVEWRGITTRLREIFDAIAPLGPAEAPKSDVDESGGQEALHTGDTEGPKTHFHQCHHECPCKIPEQIVPDIWGI